MEYLDEEETYLRDLSRETDIPLKVLKERYREYGWRGKKLVSPVAEVRIPISVEYRGKSLTLLQLSSLTGLLKQTLYDRYKKGLRGEELVTPIKEKEVSTKILFKGKRRTLEDIAKAYSLDYATVFRRYSYGLRDDDLIAGFEEPKEEETYTMDDLYELYKGFAEEKRYDRLEKLSGFMGLEASSEASPMLHVLEDRYRREHQF